MDPDKAYNIQRSAQRFAEKEEDAPEVDPDKAYNVQMAEQKMPFTPQMMMEPVDLGEFYKNQAAIGTVNTLKLLGYGGTWAIANWQMLEGEERDQYVDNNMRIIEQTLNDVAGVDPDLLKSGNYIHDTLGGGVQALFDPFSYTAMGIGSRAYNFLRTLFAATKTGQVVPATGAAANLVGRAGVAGGTALVAGTAAGPGVDIAESFLDAMGVESEGARLGGMLAGGFLGGAAGIKASGAIAVPVIKTGVGKLRGPVASGWQKARNLYYGIDDMDNTMTGDVYQKLKLATRENPDFEDIIISATEMAKEVPDFILPVEAIAADNAVLMPFMSRAIRNNPEYRYKTQMRIKNARDALEKWRLRHHGVSGDAADKLVRDSIDSEFRVKRKRIATELENNSKKMNQAMQRLEVGEYKEQIGNEATRLVKDRIKFLREQYGMQYDIALRKAEKAGLRLEPQAAITFNKNIQQFFQNHVFEEMPK
ncbi:MAG: hypothetical protein MI784_13555, partial [Cytophagales bacterium]|nr:hypothetical protein [Cytophagales bacterium]